MYVCVMLIPCTVHRYSVSPTHTSVRSLVVDLYKVQWTFTKIGYSSFFYALWGGLDHLVVAYCFGAVTILCSLLWCILFKGHRVHAGVLWATYYVIGSAVLYHMPLPGGVTPDVTAQADLYQLWTIWTVCIYMWLWPYGLVVSLLDLSMWPF